MSEIKDGGPAFPVVGLSQRNGQEIISVFNGGMTLRDYFAAAALTGLIASPHMHITNDGKVLDGIKDNTEASFKYANAMIAAREAE